DSLLRPEAQTSWLLLQHGDDLGHGDVLQCQADELLVALDLGNGAPEKLAKGAAPHVAHREPPQPARSLRERYRNGGLELRLGWAAGEITAAVVPLGAVAAR